MDSRLHDRKIAVVGLGYVGLPVALAMGNKRDILAFDINSQRVRELKSGYDKNGEVGREELLKTRAKFCDQAADIADADFFIVAVPTPVDAAKKPDLSPLLAASRSVGSVLKRGDVVVFESTVYPGATEEECVPVLEASSGLKCGEDFTVGYSPERINPGDQKHTFSTITKVVAGQDAQTLEIVAQVYGEVVTAGVYRARSIKVAEAAKVIENTQRDLNIALINELAIIFEKMGIDTGDVLEAAGTKWNFLPFQPGLVGGHCIGVDPYYLTHKATMLGYIPEVILAGRKINDGMGAHVAQRTIKLMIQKGQRLRDSVVTVLGLTFKENCPDLRNSRVVDVIAELQSYGLRVQVCDPLADPAEAMDEYGVQLCSFEALQCSDAIIVAVAHDAFRQLSPDALLGMMGELPVLFDVKGIYDRESMSRAGISLLRL